ncbi:hypothetical protein BWQ96_00447 [Gracilariopsis chorda]|uniref:Uncharacterized protein n=1 Tax=Gracilariopsis chorda TaxID=448386 RepID=A0A2V3J5V8_9FLOR|nr:hypothetical protein BWQ96_00447 [Gracilariopsis chorda]|eukprot:PXF49795.1 hypothetical protein BWQ96_00447 [Gracilariopsis chorda]
MPLPRILCLLLLLLLLCSPVYARMPELLLDSLFSRFVRPNSGRSHARRSLAKAPAANENDASEAQSVSTEELRSRIAEHRIQISRMEQETEELKHEKSFLEKSIELKKGQRNMQDGQVKLSQAVLEDKAREIAMYKREAPRTLRRYNELIRRQRQLQNTLNRLHRQSQELSTTKEVIMNRLQNLTVHDLVERHARTLPDAMAGALRKGAAVVVPFFDYLAVAADTNNRLVDHVGSEIDRFTYVNLSSSPFLSGILYYCILLVPLLSVIGLLQRVLVSSTKITVSACLFYSNLYFIFMCVVNVFASLVLHQDPLRIWSKRYETSFVVANLVLAAYYMWHTAMLALQTALSFDKGTLSQLVGTITVGIHYYVFAWRKVFTDSPPAMYAFNYMMYATIFCFILYDRYSRMNSRQLNENGLLRFIDEKVKGFEAQLFDTHAARGWLNAIGDWFTIESPRSRRFSARRSRVVVSDKHNHRSEKGNRLTSRRMPLSDSEELDEAEEQPLIRKHRHRIRQTAPQSQRPERGADYDNDTDSRGFISMFFGNVKKQDSSSSEDEEEAEEQTQSGVWSLFSRSEKKARDTTREESRRKAKSRHRYRDKKDPGSSRFSIWKWS